MRIHQRSDSTRLAATVPRRTESVPGKRSNPYPSVHGMLQLQRISGNRAVERLLNEKQDAILSNGGDPRSDLKNGRTGIDAPVIQRATLVVNDRDEKDSSVLEDAKMSHAGGVLFDMKSNRVVISNKKPADTHLDVFGHGNEVTIGPYDEEALAREIQGLFRTLNLTALNSLTLHSCLSGRPLDLGGEPEDIQQKYKKIEGTTLAERVNRVLLDRYKRLVKTTGFMGKVVTDTKGRSRVLIDETKEDEYRLKRATAVKEEDKQAVEDRYLYKVSEQQVSFLKEAVLMITGELEPETQLSDEDVRNLWAEYQAFLEQMQEEDRELPEMEMEDYMRTFAHTSRRT